jgi:hypothetical protein
MIKRIRSKTKKTCHLCGEANPKNFYERNQSTCKRCMIGNANQEHKKEPSYFSDRRKELRTELLGLLGSKCVKCGFSDIRALQVDHIHGGGSKHLRRSGGSVSYYTAMIKAIKLGVDCYQLLCASCNWIKRYENNEV